MSCTSKLRVLPAALLMLGAGCSPDGPTDLPNELVAGTIVRVDAGAAPASGELALLALRVLTVSGEPVPNAPVTLTPLQGTVEQAELEADADGLVQLSWQLLDQDRRQVLRVASGDAVLEIAFTTAPRIVALALHGVPASMTLGDDTMLTVRRVTSTGRELPQLAYSITIESTAPLYAELPVVALDGRRVRAIGPGTFSVRAQADTLESASVTIEVPAGQPIATRVTPDELGAQSGIVLIEGYDLDGIEPGDVLVDGAATMVESIGPLSIEVGVTAAADCAGRDVASIEVAGAYLPNGPLHVRRPRPEALALEVGAVRMLGRASSLCVPLAGAPDAEYVLAYFDTRGLVSAETQLEDWSYTYAHSSFAVADRSVAAAAAPQAAARAAVMPGERPFDVVRVGSSPAAVGQSFYDDLWDARTTPWAEGDTFAIWDDMAQLAPGVVFWANDRFAVGALLRDSVYEIAQRLTGVEQVLDRYTRMHEDYFQRVFGSDRPVTTTGSGQMLIMVGDFWAAGLTFVGSDTASRGVLIAIDPVVAESPPGSELGFPMYVLIHEMAHAYQDRYRRQRCIEAHDCGYDVWEYRWSVEGGADFITQLVMANDLGYSFDGNHPFEGAVNNSLGPVVHYGDFLTPHYAFSEGYGSASWLLRDLLHRATDAGFRLEDTAGEIVRGALDGWYGHGRDGAQRPGLVPRMRTLFGVDWEPAQAVMQALLSIGADDRSGVPALQVPFLEEMWLHYRKGGELVLGQSHAQNTAVVGLTFAHFDVRDPEGLGGTLELGTDGAVVDWAIVRVE